MTNRTQKAAALKKKFEKEWFKIPGVTAVGLGLVDGEVGIIVSVEGNIEKMRAKVPEIIEGISVQMKYSGTIRAQ